MNQTLICTRNGYQIARTVSGGKAGTGFNKTGSVRVLGEAVCKYFRYTIGSQKSYHIALSKAFEFVGAPKP